MRMKAIEEVYPDALESDGYWWGASDYGRMVESLGYDTLLQVDDDDYQGDSRYVLRDNSRYGILIFGWGSCSGCDALQACGSYKELSDLRDGLHDSIKWHDSAAGLLTYIREKDWDLDYAWHSSETRQFIEQADALLSALGEVE